MAILIAGGAGFVGLNVAEQLLRDARDVVIFSTTRPMASALRVFESLPGQLHVEIGSVCSAADIDRVIRDHRVDRIINAAAVTADLAREKQAAQSIFDVNVGGTIELLEAACRHQVQRVLQLSSGAVFGSAGNQAAYLDEEGMTLPDSLYGISKYAAERIALRYRATRGLDVLCVRLGSVFGKWEHDTGVRDTLSMVLQTYLVARRGGRAVLHAHPSDDWVYSVDVARGLIALLSLENRHHDLFHLSAGRQWSIETWCRLLKQRFPAFEYRFSDRIEDCTLGGNRSMKRSPLAIGRITAEAGFEPTFVDAAAFHDFLAWAESVDLGHGA